MTVTIILVGENTNKSKWVQYKIDESIRRGNGLLEINISETSLFGRGKSGFCGWMLPVEYKGYEWFENDGYNSLATWVETAALAAGK